MAADEAIHIMCPNLVCRKVLAVPQAARGKTVRCKHCRTAIRIPMPGEKPGIKPASTESPAAPAA